MNNMATKTANKSYIVHMNRFNNILINCRLEALQQSIDISFHSRIYILVFRLLCRLLIFISISIDINISMSVNIFFFIHSYLFLKLSNFIVNLILINVIISAHYLVHVLGIEFHVKHVVLQIIYFIYVNAFHRFLLLVGCVRHDVVLCYIAVTIYWLFFIAYVFMCILSNVI